MKAIILAGGFGTRLRTLVKDVPKPMAPIKGRPFLAVLIDYLREQGITEVVLSTHYQHDAIADFFGDHYAGVTISYAREVEPLGTGGAIMHAFSTMKNDSPCFVLNGDTFVKLNYQAMFAAHVSHHAGITMALCHMTDCERYGSVEVQNDRVVSFNEKGNAYAGLINAGVYLLTPQVISQHIKQKSFSFENDFLKPFIHEIKPHAFLTEGYFIDIGVPEDYLRAQAELVRKEVQPDVIT